jgi:hypothetical protein
LRVESVELLCWSIDSVDTGRHGLQFAAWRHSRGGDLRVGAADGGGDWLAGSAGLIVQRRKNLHAWGVDQDEEINCVRVVLSWQVGEDGLVGC